MARIASVNLSITVEDGYKHLCDELLECRFAPNVYKREVLSLTGSGFTALTVPTGASLAIINPVVQGVQAAGVTLKGVTGDTGIAAVPSSLPITAPIMVPLGTTPSIGLANASASAQSVEVIWL